MKTDFEKYCHRAVSALKTRIVSLQELLEDYKKTPPSASFPAFKPHLVGLIEEGIKNDTEAVEFFTNLPKTITL